MKAEGELRLAYMEPECNESGMKLQELDLCGRRFPFKSSRFTIEPGGASPPDKHSVAEMWIIVEGMGELIWNEESYNIEAGDVVYFGPFDTHLVRNHSAQALKVLSFWWRIHV
jgi:quercetin dioxygenase-like cupin family protein